MGKTWPVIVLAALLIAIFCISCYSSPSDHNQQQGATNATPVPGITTNNQSQTSERCATPSSPPGWRRAIAWPEGVTSLGVFLTLFFIAWQALLMRQAIISSESSSKQELRAYLSVVINGGSYQDRAKGIRFDGVPILNNVGKTPAYNVTYRTNSAVLRDPLSKDGVLAYGEKHIGEYTLGMNQNFTFRVIADDFVDPNDVADIMSGTQGRAFHYWGEIEYDDIFGDRHALEFCHRLYFVPDAGKAGEFKVHGNYIPGRNKETRRQKAS